MSLVWTKIKQERGWDATGDDSELKSMVWEELKLCELELWLKEDRMTFAKWFSLYDAGKDQLYMWHTRQVLFTVLCVGDGLLNKTYFTKIQDVFARVREACAGLAPPGEHMNMDEGAATLPIANYHMYSASPVTLAYYYDDDCRRREQLVATVFAGARQAHGDQNVRNRSQEESACVVG